MNIHVSWETDRQLIKEEAEWLQKNFQSTVFLQNNNFF